jgi:hypothetical protein
MIHKMVVRLFMVKKLKRTNKILHDGVRLFPLVIGPFDHHDLQTKHFAHDSDHSPCVARHTGCCGETTTENGPVLVEI